MHTAKDYAPAGYQLVATHYDASGTTHVFAAPGKELRCLVAPGEDEAAALEAFKAAHSKRKPKAEP